MIDLKQFKNNAISRGLCSGYTDKWSDEKSKKELFELACDANSVSYMAESISEGWGLSPEFISEKFKAYINGKYICMYKNDKGNGYTSLMLCDFREDSFNITTTLACILSSKTTLNIKPFHICRLYVSGNSEITINLGENSICFIYVYGNSVIHSCKEDVLEGRVHIERVEKKEKENNG